MNFLAITTDMCTHTHTHTHTHTLMNDRGRKREEKERGRKEERGRQMRGRRIISKNRLMQFLSGAGKSEIHRVNWQIDTSLG